MIMESLPVGIIVERRELDHPWQPYSWHAVAVLPGAPPVSEWRLLAEGPGWQRYHADTLEIQLFAKETEGYRYNLSTRVPSVFVVLRPDEDGDSGPTPFLATVCPYEAQDYMDTDEVVDMVPMPADMVAWVGQFVTKHHVEEPFQKRKRKPHVTPEGGAGPKARSGRFSHGRR